MFAETLIEKLTQDKNLYYLSEFSVLTVYDDNLFVRNDYDVLSLGQRNYVIDFFKPFGFKQKSGKLVTDGNINLHFPKPKHTLALSAYQSHFNNPAAQDIYVVTPSTFAEVIWHETLIKGVDWGLEQIQLLIKTCPYNIELIRDINYRSPIEALTQTHFKSLQAFQANVIEEKFKFKKAL